MILNYLNTVDLYYKNKKINLNLNLRVLILN